MLIPNFLLNGFKNYYDNSIETVFVWFFFVPLINFTLIRRCSHYRGRAANLSYALQSWLLNSEGSLACHIYCDTGHAFTMVIPEDPWRWQFLPSDWQKSCYYCICFYDLLGLSLLGFEQTNFQMRDKRSNRQHHRRGRREHW